MLKQQKCYNVNVHKYQDHPKSDENSESFENEALFRGTVGNEYFTSFANGDNQQMDSRFIIK